MRVLAFVLGITTVTCATAGEFDAPIHDTDAMTAQFVYESRFGGASGVPATSAFKLQFANEGQRLSGVAPLQAEFRPASGEFYVNGMNVQQLLIARQGEEGGGISALWSGWLPLVIVIGAASLILVDGYDADYGSGGSGGSGS
jgi:hypothetical protein